MFSNRQSPDVTKEEFKRAMGFIKKQEIRIIADDIVQLAERDPLPWKVLNPDKDTPTIGPKAIMIAIYAKAARHVNLPDTPECRAAVRAACEKLGVEPPERYRRK